MRLLVGDTVTMGMWIKFEGMEIRKKYKVTGVTRQEGELYYEFTRGNTIIKHRVKSVDVWVTVEGKKKFIGEEV